MAMIMNTITVKKTEQGGGGFPTWPVSVNQAPVDVQALVSTGTHSYFPFNFNTPFIKLSQTTNHPAFTTTSPATLTKGAVEVMYTQKQCRAVIGDADVLGINVSVEDGDGIWMDIPADTFVFFAYSVYKIGNTKYTKFGIYTSKGDQVVQTVPGLTDNTLMFLDDKVGN